MNLRPGQWNLPLIERLCRLASVLKLNEEEAATLSQLTGVATAAYSHAAFCKQWAARYQLDAICITLGAAGSCIYENRATLTVPGYPVAVHDTVGAGDAFAAAFLHGYHRQWPSLQTASYANALGSIVASRPGATPAWTMQEWTDRAASLPQ
jgi:fructokinase